MTSALRYHLQGDVSTIFRDVERLIRDEFDWFFFRLGGFHQFIASGVLEYKELDGFLSYIIDLTYRNKSEPLNAAIAVFIREYDYGNVQKMIDLRKAHKAKPPADATPAKTSPAPEQAPA